MRGRHLVREVRQYVENAEGVHLVVDAEYTLCGDALEIGETEDEDVLVSFVMS